MKQLEIATIFVLIVLGICEPLGVLLGLPGLRAAGRLTAASNAPLVFNQVGGIEFWANHHRFRIRDLDGRVLELDGDRDLVGRIRGPHTRKAAYIVPLGLGAIAGPDLYLTPLRYGFCDPGALMEDWGISNRVSAEVRRIVYTTNAIESLKSTVRRSVRSKGHFPNDQAATKLIWLSLRNAESTWKRPPIAWQAAKAQLATQFGERFNLED